MAKRVHAGIPSTRKHGCCMCRGNKNVRTLQRKGGRLFTMCDRCIKSHPQKAVIIEPK